MKERIKDTLKFINKLKEYNKIYIKRATICSGP